MNNRVSEIGIKTKEEKNLRNNIEKYSRAKYCNSMGLQAERAHE